MPHSLKGRVAIVTGGGRGIGRAASIGLAREGAMIVATARTSEEVQGTAEMIRSEGGTAVALTGDVRKDEDVTRVTKETLRLFGHIDILMNNAGIDGSSKPLVEVSEDELMEVLEVNVAGIFRFSRAVLPHMIQERSGNIVNVSSGAGIWRPGRKVRSITYTVSKFAVEGLTYAMASSLNGTGVNVNSFRPGYTKTGFQSRWTKEELLRQEEQHGEPRKPEAVIPLVVYLAALDPGEMTGQSIDAKEWRGGEGTASQR